MLRASVSGMPNNGCPFPGTTKNLHFFLLILCSTTTIYVPTCVIVVLLYVFNSKCLFFVVANHLFVTCGNNFLNTHSGIMFPLLPVSGMVSCSILFTALVLLLLQTFWKWPILLHSVYTFPYARHCLRGGVLMQYLHVCFNGMLNCVGPLSLFSLCACLATQILSNSFVSVVLLITAAWALCASTLFTHDKIFSLVMVSFPLIVVSFFMISPNISSLSPWMNCSFHYLCNSW